MSDEPVRMFGGRASQMDTAASVTRDLVDKDGAVVGEFQIHVALVPPSVIGKGPEGQTAAGPIWTFNVNGKAGDIAFMIIMSTTPVDETDRRGLEIVGAELGRLLHGICHQIESATEVAGSVIREHES